MTRLAIFDYGAGNLFSLRNALERHDTVVDIVTDFTGECRYDGLLLPGVGSFDPAIQKITGAGLREYTGNGIPVLGICLGMEIFFEASHEGVERGLGIMAGNVIALPESLKVPHMGWNSLEITGTGRLLDGIENGSWAYFVHSYRAEPADHSIVMAESDYGARIPAVVEWGNYFGTQFHPEKSGSAGSAMLQNFIRECKK